MEKTSPLCANTIRKVIHCQGTPRQCGRQYGETAREEIRLERDTFREGLPNGDWDAWCGSCRKMLRASAPDVLEEMEGLAEGADIPLEHVLLLNQWPDLKDVTDRCTPVFLRDSDRGPLVAKNNDGAENERHRCPFILRRVSPSQGVPFLQVTYAGWLSGLDMLNAEGLANTHGSVGSRFPRPQGALDIRLRMYQMMRRCRNVQEALEFLMAVPLTGKGFSIAIGDASGDNALIDAAVPRIQVCARRVPQGWSTNLYQSEECRDWDWRTAEARALNAKRGEFLAKRMREAPPQTLAELQELLRSHEPYAPCRHGTGESSSTFWSMIALPAERKLLLCGGAPCCTAYQEHVLWRECP
ncbi:MAG: hypothetical protein IJJ33_06290 [Victivallales bacterium]|nr:hypothetical protein [Victivallales bacterium]